MATVISATPSQAMGRVGARQGQTYARVNPPATLAHLRWPELKSSLSSSKQEATAELPDTYAHPKQPPKLPSPANTAVNICEENIPVRKGVRAAPHWSSELHKLNMLLPWERQHPTDYVNCKWGFTTEKL